MASGRCPNEALRNGRSASLPDCRAYELVTPEKLSRTADMTFEAGLDKTAVSSDGEHVALETSGAYFEPAPSASGTYAVFSRTSAGWTMKSIIASGLAGDGVRIWLLSPENLSWVALISPSESLGLSLGTVNSTLYTGPVGGPYESLSVPRNSEPKFVGANAGTPSTQAFSHVFFKSNDHELLPPGPERETAEGTGAEYVDLYEWTAGQLHLVNVNSEGRLLNPCGAELGEGSLPGSAIDAVSADGSKIFFTSPQAHGLRGCPEPALYMRVDGRETVDVSEPEGVSVAPSARGRVDYDGASDAGSKVFFTTETALTPGATVGSYIYEYNTEAPARHRLTLIANEASSVQRESINPNVVVSEDGSSVYYHGTSIIAGQGTISGIWRYDTVTGTRSFVAIPSETIGAEEPWYTAYNGGFLVFPSGRT
jgi:hypothetical protein